MARRSMQSRVTFGDASITSTPRFGSTRTSPLTSARFTASRVAASGRSIISTSPGIDTNCPAASVPSRSAPISRP